MTPVCPFCGSVRVEPALAKGRMHCLEPDCGREGAKKLFREGGPKVGWSAHPNTSWRDPESLTMDGQDR